MDMQAAPGFAVPRLVPPVPAPPERELPTLRFIAAMRVNGIGCWPASAYEAPLRRRRLFGRTRFTVSDPDLVRHVLVDNAANYARTPITIRMLRPMLGDGLLISEGTAWRHQRRTLAPAFTPRAVETLVPHILSASDEAVAALEDPAARGPVDLFAALQRLALEIAGRTMFSVGMARHGDRLRGFLEAYAARLGRPHLTDLLVPLRFATPLDRARARFRRDWVFFLDEVIADRDEGQGGREVVGEARDLLDLLRAARDPETGRGFSHEELRDQVATMILAGHETTAVTLLWACTLLALSPQTQAAVAAEAASAEKPFTRAVIEETLRLYPAAFVLARRAVGPDVLGGEAVEVGDSVTISPWLLHRHRKLWRDPDAFDPGRFLPGAPPVPRFAYLPFGAGPRVCIGAAFALTEATLALSRIVGHFRIERADARPVLPAAVVTTQPDHAPAFRLTRRA
ncbi:cytochrome P450 [Methylorubrum rhodesianum]|uniref:cytochrome P450 n=1 Tax=Methylorubrum TaxID=2282523 RepID=UPI0016114684|nr:MULTISPECIES: cytochrome P450 [Methylorubrum]MBB5763484.1 cytochrome P450 [Methylorubrum rhodesianum]MBI1690781.1 cytochrome P450 [Methylorubrum sp. DB1722]